MMQNATPFYCALLDNNRAAFAQGQYLVAYHVLSAAMYCALGERDTAKMKEVLELGCGQLEELNASSGNMAFPNETVEVSLYRSLVQMTRTRLLLLER